MGVSSKTKQCNNRINKMYRFVSLIRKAPQIQLALVDHVQMASFATASKNKKKRQLNKDGDMYSPIIIDELKMEDFLNPTKKGLSASIKDRYYNWNSEYNIKKTFKTYKSEDMNKVVCDMLGKLQEFFVKGELMNATALVTPLFMQQFKDKHYPIFSPSQLKGLQKDLRYVGYSLSYLDTLPSILQTRIIKSKGILYGQVTLGLKCIEDIYGWTSRGNRIQLDAEFPNELPTISGNELPIDSKQSEWKESKDSENHTYYYNSITKVSSWNNPDNYSNRRRYCAYLCVLERPLLSTMGNWRFQKV